MENKKWWIPGSVPSSKNGRRWTGKYFIASKTVVNYRKITKEYYEKYAKDFKFGRIGDRDDPRGARTDGGLSNKTNSLDRAVCAWRGCGSDRTLN